jgi:hypothetical protein
MLYQLNNNETITLPGKFEVCWRCEGRGVHDCWEGGMTGDEMAEQGPEFFEDYMSGMYDTKCSECNGRRVLEVPDRERADADLLAIYDENEREAMEYAAEVAAERRMGC